MTPQKTPDFYQSENTIIETPDKWNGGYVKHSGGGIYCREWHRELPDGKKIEIGYSSEKTGVGINYYGNNDTRTVDECFTGFITDGPHEPETNTDQAYANTAKRLMELINTILNEH